MSPTSGTTIATFPRADAAFAAYVLTCLDELEGADDPARLEQLIRRWHTRAIVRPQAQLAELGGRRTWYVYRDGRAGMRSEESWWRDPGMAHVRFRGDGRFIEADDEACALVARAPGGLLGAHWSELVPMDARSDRGEWLWKTLAETGQLDSVFEFPLEDGTRHVIQYHSQPTLRPGEYEGWWRALTTVTTQGAPRASDSIGIR